MQLQQLRSQNQLLQQLVATLQRQIQSKNQQQTIMIKELQHLIKENDHLSHKHNALMAQSRNWNEKEKYYERLIKDIEDTLGRTRAELSDYKKKFETQSQQLMSVNLANNHSPQSIIPAMSQSSPIIQVPSQGSNSGHGLLINRGNEQVQGRFVISVPRLHIQNSHMSVYSLSTNNNTTIQQQQVNPQEHQEIQQESPISQLSFVQSQQLHVISNLKSEIKHLKSQCESMKLWLTQKDIEVKSRTQKLYETSQELIQSQEQVENLATILDSLRKEYDLAMGDVEKKEQEIKLKDEQFWNMYKEIDDEWKVKYDKLQEDLARIKQELTAKSQADSQVDTLMSIVKEREQQIQAQSKMIEELTEQVCKSQLETEVKLEPESVEVQPPVNNLQLESLQKIVQELSQTLVNTQKQHNIQVEQLAKQHQAKEQAFYQTSAQITAENNKIKEREQDISTENKHLKEKITLIEQQLTRLNHEISESQTTNTHMLTQEKDEQQVHKNQLRHMAALVETTKVQLQYKDRQLQEEQTGRQSAIRQLNQANQQTESLQSRLCQLQSELSNTKTQLYQVQVELTQTNNSLSQAQQVLSQTQSELSLVQTQLSQTQNNLSQTQTQLSQAQIQLKQSQNVFIQTQFIIQQLQQQNESLIKQTIALKQDKQQLIQSLHTSRDNHHPQSVPQIVDQTVQALQKQNNQLRQQLNEFAKNFQHISITVQDMRNHIQQLQHQLQNQQNQNHHLLNQLSQINTSHLKTLSENTLLQEQLSLFTSAQQLLSQPQKLLPVQQNTTSSQPQPASHESSPNHPTRPSNYVELEMFEALQQEYTRLYEELEDVKQLGEDERSRFLAVIEQKDFELANLRKKVQELTNLFALKTVENDQIRQSIDKQPSSGKIPPVFKNTTSPNADRPIPTNSRGLNLQNTDNFNKHSKNPSPCRSPEDEPSRRSLPRQQNRPSLPHHEPSQSPTRQQPRNSLPHNKYYNQNLVENNLSSPRSHEQKTPNQILLVGQIDQSNDGFDIRIQPTVRKSDLPLHSPEFLENSCESKPQRPKSNLTSGDQSCKRQQLEAREYLEIKQHHLQPPVEIDINFLRNSIAGFGLDIDFNAIAKHIGLEVTEQEEEERRKQEERQKKRLNSGRDKASDSPNINISQNPNMQNPAAEMQDQLNQQKQHQDAYDNIITSKQSVDQLKSDPKKPHAMYSSYGSNPSRSQKRSTPNSLRIPHVYQELMRSQYGSKNQFTQIVLYYEEELNKLRRHLQEVSEQMARERMGYDERVKKLEREVKQAEDRFDVAVRENGDKLGMIEEAELKNHEEINIANQDQLIQQQQYSLIPQNNPQAMSTMRPMLFLPLPQTSEFRTSIQPRLGASFQLPYNNRNEKNLNNNSRNQSATVGMTAEQQQETVELIRQFSSQLEIIQQTLAEKQDELRMAEGRYGQTERENSNLKEEVEMIRKENQHIVNQFSELSLQQNNCITELEHRLQEKSTKLDQSQQIHSDLESQHSQLNKQHSELKQQFNSQSQNFQQEYQTITTQLNEKTQMIQKITIENVEYETQLLQLNQQVQQLVGKLQQIQQLHQNNTNDKDDKIKKLQKSLKDLEKTHKDLEKTHKSTQEQLQKYTNENQSLASEFSNFIQTSKQLQSLTKKHQDLENHSKSVQTVNKNLDAKVKTLQTNCKTLETSNKALQTQYRTLETSNKTLETQYKTLETHKKSVQAHNKSLESHNKSIQQKLSKLTLIQQRQSSDSATVSPASNRISDLMQSHQTSHQQNFTINNISNIHAIVDQLGDDSFITNEKDKEISVLKDIVEKQRREIELLVDEAKDREGYVSEMEDKFANIENSFNAQIMDIKKQNAELNSELLKLKKQLFTYQKDNGDINKFIQQNFLTQKPAILKRFSAQSQNQDRFHPGITHQVNRSDRHNNSFNFEPYQAHDVSSLSSRNKVNMTQFYYPKEKQPSKILNMGELFIGHKTRTRPQNNSENDNSLTQLIKSITSSNKNKSMTQAMQPSGNRLTNYGKYLNEYERYEQKIRLQARQDLPQAMLSQAIVGHMKKRSDHGE